MMIKNNLKLRTINNGGISFRFLETGDIYDVTYNDYQINLVKGNVMDGSLMNVYLRIKKDHGYISTPLIHKDILSGVSYLDHQVTYYG
ncbi:MAG: hypothetical protein CVV58_06405, partial [Tenericutes bacterium HGW-Tenericutes-3]